MADDQKLLVRCFPIDWAELQLATADVIDLAKIQRCNSWFLTRYPGLDNERQRYWLIQSRIPAREDPTKSSAQLPPGVEHPAKFPVDQVKSQEGIEVPGRHVRTIAMARLSFREGPFATTVDSVARAFQLIVDEWNESESGRRLKSAVRRLITGPERIDKIVCFGLAFVDNIQEDHTSLTRRSRAQHAAMLTIRDTLQEMIVAAGHGERKIQIFTQDPEYDDWNRIVLEKHGMTVVDAGYGHHEGFLKVDRNTMVVDTTCGIANIWQPCLEFTEPAAFLSQIPCSLEDVRPPRACWTAFDQKTNTPICVPGSPFTQTPTEDVVKKLMGEYTTVALGDVDDLNEKVPESHFHGFSKYSLHIRND